ncbi:hypothetical protein SVXHr_1943 [Halorhabdus sp. SVX81]|uniref:DUF7333 family protein n=1 Tax=Halorhabdus sp. SVX81 TaxID=2978283 RepID=UPI0023DAB041|nr:hypothetical protein [Halorhabdus sp. SVX81]WEL18104.1 hypothetical protein SVXHr_1943 [Halorhabdus sp. SVX81]
MDRELSLPVAVGVILAVIAAGTGGLIVAPIGMTAETTLMMVLPSMVGFAALVFVVGVMHGQYRANM